MWRVHCIRRAGEPGPPPGLLGPDRSPVRLVVEPPLAAWVSPASPGPATVPRLRDHDRVVREALRSATPLPVRYGTLLRDEDDVRRTLRERRAEWLDALDGVRGRVEMGVQLRWAADDAAGEGDGDEEDDAGADAAAAGRGREYLRRRRRELRRRDRRRARAEALLDRVERQLQELQLPSRRSLLPRPEVAGVLAHLVQREQVAVYRQRAEQAGREVDAELHLSGPWAPYSFV